MKRHEEGQGLVEYALILVLVALVVIEPWVGVGPAIDDVFCPLIVSIPSPGSSYDYVQRMKMSDELVVIDVKETLENALGVHPEYPITFEDIVSFPSHGTVVNHRDGTFTYRPNEVGSGTDDSFTYEWSVCPARGSTSLVTIIIGETDDPSVSQAYIMTSAEPSTLEWDDVKESILALFEEALAQEESLEEGVDLTVEAVVEGLEVLIDYADDIDNQALSEALSQVVQDIKDGNLDAVPDVADYLVAELEEIPPEVWTALSLKTAPRLIDSCETVSGGFVSPDAIAAAQEALEQLDPDYPGKAEKQQQLQEAVDIIEERQSFSESWLEVNSYVLDLFIAGLESVGEVELAAQLAADSEVCGY